MGETILDVALREAIDIPHLCKHPDLNIKGNCRTCLVEVAGMGIVTSCSTQVKEGMKVKTETPKVRRARKINLELIFASHIEKCDKCIYENNCILLKYAKEYGLNIKRFGDRKEKYPIWQFGDAIQFDASKCIGCRNCVEVCQLKQACDFYEVAERGVETEVKPKGEPNSQSLSIDVSNTAGKSLLSKENWEKFDCVYCGQCIVHCPVGAISGVPHWGKIEHLLENKGNKILVAQIAPSVRVSIGEEFDQQPGKIVTGQLVASIKKLGFDYVFDINTGADFTTYEEARELIDWLRSNKERPMFTSCCPAWVKFVEFYFPEFISHLTSTSSPHICSGSIIKTIFADSLKRDPRDIILVSIMPCTAKKHEIDLKEHQIDINKYIKSLDLKNIKQIFYNKQNLQDDIKVPAVDYVLTTREYAYLLQRHKIDLLKLKPAELDKPLGIYSSAGAIYGASGGVMESALRSADYFFRVLDKEGNLEPIINGKLKNYKPQKSRSKASSKISKSRIKFKKVRGMQGIKTAKINIAGRKLKIAVVNGLNNARKMLESLKDNKMKYDYVEVMACPGGCIGGGGQPLPVDSEIRKKRAEALYEVGRNLPIKTAHENPSVLEVYSKYFKGNEELISEMLHNKYKAKKREGYYIISN